jgi:hypothetical protein
LGKQKRHILRAPPTFKAGAAGSEEAAPKRANDGEEQDLEIVVEEADVDEEDEEGGEEEEQAADDDDGEVPERPTKVQILDLDTLNPIVSYDGHVYSCQWAENLGTEMLFIAHDDNASLPILCTLPGNVDLLAMSSARIVPQAVQLQPKEKIPVMDKRKPVVSQVSDLSIPVGHGASMKRKQQARFLEKLMAAKEKKGEEDFVTVLTTTRLSFPKWVTELKAKRQIERNELNYIIKHGQADNEDVLGAKERLKEMDIEDEKRDAELASRSLGPDGRKLNNRSTDHRKRAQITDPVGVEGDTSKPPKKRIRGRPRKNGAHASLGDLLGNADSETQERDSLTVDTPRTQRYSDSDEDGDSPGMQLRHEVEDGDAEDDDDNDDDDESQEQEFYDADAGEDGI